MSNDFKRTLGLVAVVAVFVAVAAGGWTLFVAPWLDYEDQIARLDKQVFQKSWEVRKKLKDRAELEKYRLISLPSDPDVAQMDYDRHLSKLLQKAGFQSEYLKPINVAHQPAVRLARGAAKKEPVFQPVLFEVRGRASPTELRKFLHEFKKTPLLHKIKSMHIEPVNKEKGSGDLRVNMVIEAIIVQGAPKKQPGRYRRPPAPVERAAGAARRSGGPAANRVGSWADRAARPAAVRHGRRETGL
jgi:hypothetical protein